MVDLPAPVDPLPAGAEIGPRAHLFAVLARIDGWGDRAWAMAYGAWRLGGGGVLTIEPREGDADPLVTLVLERHGLGRTAGDGDAAPG